MTTDRTWILTLHIETRYERMLFNYNNNHKITGMYKNK